MIGFKVPGHSVDALDNISVDRSQCRRITYINACSTHMKAPAREPSALTSEKSRHS